jgi:hypothetical protein
MSEWDQLTLVELSRGQGGGAWRARSQLRRIRREINAFEVSEARRAAAASVLRSLALWGTLVALAWLLPSLAWADTPACDAPPPAAEEWTWTLRAGCVVPFDVIAYTLSADLHARRTDQRDKSEIADLRLQLDDARSDRKARLSESADHIEDAADHLDGLVARLEKVQPVAASAPAWPGTPAAWAGVAGVAALLVGGLTYAALERVGGRRQDLGAGAGAAAGAGAVVGFALWIE